MNELKKSNKKELRGEVISIGMPKTILVVVETRKPHPLYKKIVKSRKKYFAHADQEYEVGDKVIIRENRPISKNKRWIAVGKIENQS